MRTKPPTVPGIERRNSKPAIAASRAVEDTKMPDAPPPQSRTVSSTASTLAKGLPRRTTTPGKPPSRTIRLEPRPNAITGVAESRSCKNPCKSTMSLGSNSHSAAPPDLNHTNGASGAFAVSLPRSSKPLPFRGAVGVGAVGKDWARLTTPTPVPSPEGEG